MQENQSKEVAKKPQSEKEATAESKEDTPEFSKPIEKDVEEVKDAVVAVSDEPQSPFTMPEPKKAKKDPEEVARLKEVKMKQLVAEEEILSASLKETTSRSGRIRKPSRLVKSRFFAKTSVTRNRCAAVFSNHNHTTVALACFIMMEMAGDAYCRPLEVLCSSVTFSLMFYLLIRFENGIYLVNFGYCILAF